MTIPLKIIHGGVEIRYGYAISQDLFIAHVSLPDSDLHGGDAYKKHTFKGQTEAEALARAKAFIETTELNS